MELFIKGVIARVHQHPWQSPSIELGGEAALGSLVLRVSEAQSAVVNDSPVDCQSRRPGCPQATGKNAANTAFLTEGVIF